MITTGLSKILPLIILQVIKNNLLGLSGVNKMMKMKVLMNLHKQRRVLPLTGQLLLGASQ